MSWFPHTFQGSSQQPPSPMNPAMEDLPYSSCLTKPGATTLGAVASAGQGWRCDHFSPSLTDLPAVPQDSMPPSLGDLSFTSLSSGARGDPVPLSYVTLQEQRCVMSWFLGWGTAQRARFLEDLISKAVPGKVCSLLEQLNTLQVNDRPPNIFECQLRLWTQWFESWSEEERNAFLNNLEERDPIFVSHFYRGVAGTAGRD